MYLNPYVRYAQPFARTLKRWFGVTQGAAGIVAPVVTLVAVAGNVDTGNHQYAVTFVGPDGESAPSPLSNIVATVLASPGQVALTTIPLGPVGTTARKIYRTKANAPGASFLQQTIANNTATAGVQDNTADAGLGAVPPANVPTIGLGVVGRRRIAFTMGNAVSTAPRSDL